MHNSLICPLYITHKKTLCKIMNMAPQCISGSKCLAATSRGPYSITMQEWQNILRLLFFKYWVDSLPTSFPVRISYPACDLVEYVCLFMANGLCAMAHGTAGTKGHVALSVCTSQLCVSMSSNGRFYEICTSKQHDSEMVPKFQHPVFPQLNAKVPFEPKNSQKASFHKEILSTT